MAWSTMISATTGLLLATKIKLEKTRLRMEVISHLDLRPW
jgi:hypothetical protein